MASAEALVLARRFDDARPLIAALATFPGARMQASFLQGYVALESGDAAAAEPLFRAVLAERPDFARARAELARSLVVLGRRNEADEQFRLAESQAGPDAQVRAAIRKARSGAAPRNWRLSVDASVLADSNYTNGTGLDTVTIFSGGAPVAVPVDPAVREKSGIGQGAAVSGGVKLRFSDGVAIAVDGDASVTNYPGKSGDDVSLLLAMGPEFSMGKGGTASVQLFGFDRWYGGTTASRGFGARARLRQQIDSASSLTVTLDARTYDSGYGEGFGGTDASAYVVYERLVASGVGASFGVFSRRQWLHDPAFANRELGGYAGLSASLTDLLAGGGSVGLSRAAFDAPLDILSPDPRRDWRFYTSLWLAARKPLGWGLVPSLGYTYSKTSSTVPFYSTDRHRLRFGLRKDF